MNHNHVVIRACLRNVCLYPGLLACLYSCGDPTAAQPPMDALRQRHLAAIGAADLGGYLDAFTEDVAFMAPDGPPIIGRSGVAEYVRPFFSAFVTHETEVPTETVMLGNRAFEHGSLTVSMRPKFGGQPMVVYGKYLFFAHLEEDGAWRYTDMIWNSDAPSQAEPASGRLASPPAELPGSVEVSEVHGTLGRLAAAVNAGVSAAVRNELTDDVVFLPPATSAIQGQPAVVRHYEVLFQADRFRLSFLSEETRPLGNWALNRGQIVGQRIAKTGGQPEEIDQKYLMVFRRQDGAWQVARFSWNENR